MYVGTRRAKMCMLVLGSHVGTRGNNWVWYLVWRSASSALSKFPRRSFSFVHRFQAFFLIDGHAPKAQEVGRVSFLCMFE